MPAEVQKTGLSKNSYDGCKGADYVPYVPTTEVMPEITGYSILIDEAVARIVRFMRYIAKRGWIRFKEVKSD